MTMQRKIQAIESLRKAHNGKAGVFIVGGCLVAGKQNFDKIYDSIATFIVDTTKKSFQDFVGKNSSSDEQRKTLKAFEDKRFELAPILKAINMGFIDFGKELVAFVDKINWASMADDASGEAARKSEWAKLKGNFEQALKGEVKVLDDEPEEKTASLTADAWEDLSNLKEKKQHAPKKQKDPVRLREEQLIKSIHFICKFLSKQKFGLSTTHFALEEQIKTLQAKKPQVEAQVAELKSYIKALSKGDFKAIPESYANQAAKDSVFSLEKSDFVKYLKKQESDLKALEKNLKDITIAETSIGEKLKVEQKDQKLRLDAKNWMSQQFKRFTNIVTDYNKTVEEDDKAKKEIERLTKNLNKPSKISDEDKAELAQLFDTPEHLAETEQNVKKIMLKICNGKSKNFLNEINDGDKDFLLDEIWNNVIKFQDKFAAFPWGAYDPAKFPEKDDELSITKFYGTYLKLILRGVVMRAGDETKKFNQRFQHPDTPDDETHPERSHNPDFHTEGFQPQVALPGDKTEKNPGLGETDIDSVKSLWEELRDYLKSDESNLIKNIVAVFRGGVAPQSPWAGYVPSVQGVSESYYLPLEATYQKWHKIIGGIIDAIDETTLSEITMFGDVKNQYEDLNSTIALAMQGDIRSMPKQLTAVKDLLLMAVLDFLIPHMKKAGEERMQENFSYGTPEYEKAEEALDNAIKNMEKARSKQRSELSKQRESTSTERKPEEKRAASVQEEFADPIKEVCVLRKKLVKNADYNGDIMDERIDRLVNIDETSEPFDHEGHYDSQLSRQTEFNSPRCSNIAMKMTKELLLAEKRA